MVRLPSSEILQRVVDILLEGVDPVFSLWRHSECICFIDILRFRVFSHYTFKTECYKPSAGRAASS